MVNPATVQRNNNVHMEKNLFYMNIPGSNSYLGIFSSSKFITNIYFQK